MAEDSLDRTITDVTLVTVTYNSEKMAEFFAQSARLFEQVVIADNHSSDATVVKFGREIPHAKILSLVKNIGFGPGNNAGLRQVKTPYALLMNPDCKIDAKDVMRLRDYAQMFESAAIVGPRIYGTDGSEHPTFRWDFRRKYKTNKYPELCGPVSTVAGSGCCFLVNVKNFMSIHAFDENIFMYYEEDDIGLRAIAAGLDVISVPDAMAEHIGSASSAPSMHSQYIKSYHMLRSKLIMLGKYSGRSAVWIARAKVILIGPLALALFALTLQKKQLIKWFARLRAAISV